MKKSLALLCAISMLAATSCTAPEKSSKEITSVEIKTTESKTKSIELSSDDAPTTAQTQQETSSEKETETETEAAKEKAHLDEQLIWEFDNVKVYAKGIEYGWAGPEIKLLVENNSNKDISIYTDYVIINDFMVSDLSAIEVTAGNKTTDSIYILNDYIEKSKIDEIGKIELSFHAREEGSYDILAESELIAMYTSDYDESATTPVFEGETLVDRDSVKIVGLGVSEDSPLSAEIILYIENNTGKTISVYNDDFAVNGFMQTSFFGCEIAAGKKIVTDIDVLKSQLEENGINSIDNVELSFRVRQGDYDVLFETDKINFKVK